MEHLSMKQYRELPIEKIIDIVYNLGISSTWNIRNAKSADKEVAKIIKALSKDKD